MSEHRLSRVAVIGGGPAGSFFALHLLKFAGALGQSPDIHIYEPKDFSLPGPRGCNLCAGVLSNNSLVNMRELDIEIPPHIVQGRISVYSLHSPFGTLEVENPIRGGHIHSVYRGSGPLHAPLSPDVSFDRFLLRKALERGATLIPRRVKEIRVALDRAIQTDDGWEEYDLVVLATGVNAPEPKITGLDYRPPATQRMEQDELMARPEDVEQTFGGKVKVFLLPHSGLIFGSLAPKGSFISASLLRKGSSPSMDEFLSHPLVRKELPFPYRRVCGCKPRISLGMARNPVGDGFVAVGDAAATRLYKDGIGSALLTARQAAQAVAHHGPSADALRRHYVPFLKSLHRDNAHGRRLYGLHHWIQNSGAFFRAQQRSIARERTGQGDYVHHRGLWGMFTGSYSYREILFSSLKPGHVARLALETARQKLKGPVLPPARILVLGGGFAGVYAALHLEKALRRQKAVDITMVSQENFFLFTPFLHEVATGGIETRHIAFPLRSLRGKKRFTFIQGEVKAIDTENKSVLTGQATLKYDYLVLALGSVTDPKSLPGQAPYVFTLKNLYDGMAIRNHIISLFERADTQPEQRARLLNIVVAGGGATGVQLIAEMRDFIFRFLIKSYPSLRPDMVRLILVQDGERLLEDMNSGLAAYAGAVLKRKGVEIRLRSRITGLLDDAIEINGEAPIPTATVILTAGIRCNPVVECLACEKDRAGRLKVNEYLEVPGSPGVYAMGDNCSFIDPETGRPLPARAHIAVRQASTVTLNIIADMQSTRKTPWRIPWMADTVSLGSREAAVRLWRFNLFGLPARFLWLSSYLLLIPSVYVRTRVATDWFLGFVFGRDTTLLRLK